MHRAANYDLLSSGGGGGGGWVLCRFFGGIYQGYYLAAAHTGPEQLCGRHVMVLYRVFGCRTYAGLSGLVSYFYYLGAGGVDAGRWVSWLARRASQCLGTHTPVSYFCLFLLMF